MNVQTAAAILLVSFPISAEDLKAQYRQLSRERHPDMNGGSEEAFKELEEAHSFIKKHATELIQAGAGAGLVTHTLDGTPLCELGLGLGPTTNGRPCDHCKGEGHYASLSPQRTTCQACCDGFIDLHAAYPKAHRPGAERRCFICCGQGYHYKSLQENGRLFCSLCKGTGEIKLYNPVLPKGALAALNLRRKE